MCRFVEAGNGKRMRLTGMIDFSCKTNAADAACFFRVLQTTIVPDSLKNKTQNNNHKVVFNDHNS